MSIRIRRLILGSLAAAASCASVVGLAVPASADSDTITYSIIDKATTYNYVNKAQVLGKCNAGNHSFHCVVSTGKSAERTVGLDLGATFKDITATLHISSSTTVTTAAGCDTTIKAGQTLIAYPIGTKYTYKVVKDEQYIASGEEVINKHTVGTSTKTTFSPGASQISCYVS